MTTISTLRAANDNVSPASLLKVAKWNERESTRKRYNAAAKARMAQQAIELRATVAEMLRGVA